MRVMNDALDQKIASRRARLSELEREKMIVEAELRAYEDAASMLTGSKLMSTGSFARNTVLGAARRVRKTSAIWEIIVAECASSGGQVFEIDDVLTVASKHNFSPTRGNVRSQLASYVGRGLLDRAGVGAFRLTAIGQEIFRVAAPSQIPKANTETAAPKKETAESEA
jgi:hypothetical protein